VEHKIPIERADTDRVLHAERDEIDATLKASYDLLRLQPSTRTPSNEGEKFRPLRVGTFARPLPAILHSAGLLISSLRGDPYAEPHAAAMAEAKDLAERTAQKHAQRLQTDRATTDRLLNTERASSDRAVAVRDEVLGMASHDLRGLIGIIGLNAELISGAADGDDRTINACVSDIHMLAARMTGLVADLTDFVRIEAGLMSVVPTTHDTLHFLREVAGLFVPAAAARGIVLQRDRSSSEVLLGSFDDGRISQVLSNLLGNAIKFTPKDGTISLAARCVRGELVVSVKDSGCGIAPDALKRVFERFWQVPGGARVGSGLGLYISQQIIEAHGGRIWVESTVGQGTTFSFTLPISAHDSAAERAPTLTG